MRLMSERDVLAQYSFKCDQARLLSALLGLPGHLSEIGLSLDALPQRNMRSVILKTRA